MRRTTYKSKDKECEVCGGIFTFPPSKKLRKYCSRKCEALSRVGKKRSVEARLAIRNGKLGSKNPQWNGGKTELRKLIRGCFFYRQWRSDVFTRDDFTCQLCFKRGGNLNVDHIYPFYKILDDNNITSTQEAFECQELWNINNGRTLCIECHRNTETYGRPPNRRS